MSAEAGLSPEAPARGAALPDALREAGAGSRGGRSAGQAVRVLVVDDEEAQRRIVAEILAAAGYQVDRAGSLQEALRHVEAGGTDLVLTDLRMPGGSGLELLERVKGFDPEIEVVLMTAYSTIQTAVEAMRKGAYHYIAKPFEKDELVLTVGQAAEKVRLRRENRRLAGLVAEGVGYGRMLGRSEGMRRVYRVIDKVHSGSSTVLIRGESGTGKELVARAIHSRGIRKDRPFVAINCAAIPESLIESELFGHERGAFTGALASKVGRFEEAADGTLFLDEVGSMRHDLQAKLLRVIQEREFQRLGSSRLLDFGGRIVAATSQDLERLLREGRFREDLYFRLNVVPIELPPLRERPGDLPLLAQHFLEKVARELGKRVRSFSPEALDLLERYHWPGNVRELENVVERMVVLAEDTTEVLEARSVPVAVAAGARRRGGEPAPVPGAPAPAARGGPGDPYGGVRLPAEGVDLARLERSLIAQALERAGGRLEPAARLLGISYKTLQYRIKKFGLRAAPEARGGAGKEGSREGFDNGRPGGARRRDGGPAGVPSEEGCDS